MTTKKGKQIKIAMGKIIEMSVSGSQEKYIRVKYLESDLRETSDFHKIDNEILLEDLCKIYTEY
jgi:hypothetical protein